MVNNLNADKYSESNYYIGHWKFIEYFIEIFQKYSFHIYFFVNSRWYTNIFSRNFSSIKYFPLISVLFFHNIFKLIFFVS